MKNINKLERLKAYLKENNLAYTTPKDGHSVGYCDLYITAHRIAVKVTLEGEEDDQEFYQKHKVADYPVFIRMSDTPKFVIEKVQNTIIKSMVRHQKAVLRKAERENKSK
jgi:hypothetical protein